MSKQISTEVLVLGAGPGGYAAAFRAADLGKKVTLVEKDPTLGGVCLNRGCIPSKALLHLAKLKREAADAASFGLTFADPIWDLDKVRKWKDIRVVGRLTKGIAQLAKLRKVNIINGNGEFISSNTLRVGDQVVTFKQAILAMGSSPARIPNLPEDPRIMDSTAALELPDIPPRLLVIGGGYIGLEMGSIYHALGSEVTVVEFLDTLLPGADADLVKPLHQGLSKQFKAIYTGTRVADIRALKSSLKVRFEGKHEAEDISYDRVLVSVGRRPNTKGSGLEILDLKLNERGFIQVNQRQETSHPNIYAIGDLTGDPMLAHKASHEGKVAAEVIVGEPAAFDVAAIPAVIYTDPEIAWAGLTETQAKKDGIAYQKGVYPWSASGRSLANGRTDGLTKALFDPETGRLLGMGIVGSGAGDLIAEAVLAMEMGADAQDMALTIHPHPSLSETVGLAAEVVDGSVTDLYLPPTG